MEQYIGTKIIEAEPMTRGEYNYYRGWVIPENENPKDEGYHVRYSDGYESWSPLKQFEEAYRPFTGMNFGLAVESMKNEMKVTRKGWNGKGMYLFLSPALGCQMYKKYTGKDINDIQPFIVMKTADGTLVPWLASQTDILAEDWMTVE